LANLKEIRKRIASVKNTQKITRAMKMVAGARLTRAQERIIALRPYAIRTVQVLAEVAEAFAPVDAELTDETPPSTQEVQPLLARRPERNTLLLVITSDRGLCGAFNANISKRAEQAVRECREAGQQVGVAVIGRKGRNYFSRRQVDVVHVFDRVWEHLDLAQARHVARMLLRPFRCAEVDAIYLVYNEFKSAMSQRVVLEPLLPVRPATISATLEQEDAAVVYGRREFIFEPDRAALLERLVPMYVEITILRALYESMAAELGARMTAMDAATKNAAEMIDKLTLKYNRARQAAITTELMEIIGGADALQE
jgi:F-type H+-transporting ATPase subunit gamma